MDILYTLSLGHTNVADDKKWKKRIADELPALFRSLTDLNLTGSLESGSVGHKIGIDEKQDTHKARYYADLMSRQYFKYLDYLEREDPELDALEQELGNLKFQLE